MTAALIRLVVCAGIAASMLMPGTSPAAASPYLTLLTGATDGVYYPLGIAIGKTFADAMPERTIRIQATKGSVANLFILADGGGELGFALADSLIAARDGDAAAGFPKTLSGLRLVGPLYPNLVQIVATAKSGIRTLADLKGKRLSTGAPQSGTDLNARAVLKAAGLADGDVTIEQTSFADAVTAMMEDKLDAALQSAGLGVASLNELSNTTEIVMVPVPAEIVARIGAPFKAATIPANTYRGQNDAVPTAAVMNYLVTSASVPDADVVRMTTLIYGRLDDLAVAHPAARAIVLDAAALDGPVPLHRGALQFFRGYGVLRRSDAETCFDGAAPRDALAACTRLAQSEPVRSADALNRRGELQVAANAPVAALADFNAALQRDPQHRAAADNRKALARDIERQGALMGLTRGQP